MIFKTDNYITRHHRAYIPPHMAPRAVQVVNGRALCEMCDDYVPTIRGVHRRQHPQMDSMIQVCGNHKGTEYTTLVEGRR